MEERPVAAVLILASVIALGHAALLHAGYRRWLDNKRLSRFSSNPYLSHLSLQPRLHCFSSHPSPPSPPPSRPFRRWWRSPARPQRPVRRDSKRSPPTLPRLKPFHTAYLRPPVGQRCGGGGRKVNVGRSIGFLFVGVVVLLQVALGVFLGVRRWQISKLERLSS